MVGDTMDVGEMSTLYSPVINLTTQAEFSFTYLTQGTDVTVMLYDHDRHDLEEVVRGSGVEGVWVEGSICLPQGMYGLEFVVAKTSDSRKGTYFAIGNTHLSFVSSCVLTTPMAIPTGQSDRLIYIHVHV